MPNHLKDLTGFRFGHLLVIDRAIKKHGEKPYWNCRCDCGNIKVARGSKLKEGEIKSCGCFKIKDQSAAISTHGLSKTPLWLIWRGIKDRCFNSNATGWKNYGGRGITMHLPWAKDFAKFKSEIPPRPISTKRLCIDRKDNEKGYIPGNIRWVTPKQNHNNKRSNVMIEVNGITKTQQEWNYFFGRSSGYIQSVAKRLGVSRSEAVGRIIYARN